MPDKILIVDNEEDIRNKTKILLKEEGYLVVTASDGEEALRKATMEKPDLILLDIIMPGKSGLQVCEILKIQKNTRSIPIIAYIVLGRDVDKMLTQDAGADGYLFKPCKPGELRIEVKRHLDNAQAFKFAKQLNVHHDELKGKRILLEIDPSSPYERFVRDFSQENSFHKEKTIVITPNGSTIHETLTHDEDIELISRENVIRLTPIIEQCNGGCTKLVYDSLTDLALSEEPKISYKYSRDALNLLSGSMITAIFLLNPLALSQTNAYSLRGLFNNQIEYVKEGITRIRIN